MQEHGFQRAGYTVLTLLPGTEPFGRRAAELESQPWYEYDMQHVLWDLPLGAARFFELYAETWKRSILNLQGEKRWSDWMRQVHLKEVVCLTRVLLRTQRMMHPAA